MASPFPRRRTPAPALAQPQLWAPPEADTRSHPGGSALVSAAEAFGHDRSEWVVEDHGDYIASSNPVYAAVTLRSRLLSTLPLEANRPSAPAKQLLDFVNPFWTPTRLKWAIESSMCLWGESFLLLEKDRLGKVRELWWVKPTQMRIVVDPVRYISGYFFDGTFASGPIHFNADEVIWLRYPNPLDEFAGLAPMAAARLGADLESGAAQANVNLFKQGLMGGGIASARGDRVLSQEQAKEAQEFIDRKFKGVSNSARWAVARMGLALDKLDVTPKDAEFLGSMRWGVEAVARAFGLPQEMLNGERSGLTYANIRELVAWAWEITLKPEANFLATELTEQLVPIVGRLGDVVAFDLSGVEALRETRADQINNLGALVRAGFDPTDSARAVGLPPIRHLGLTPVTVHTAAEEQDTPAPPASAPAAEPARAGGEEAIAGVLEDLFRRQRSSVLSALKGRDARSPAEVALAPFEMPRWIRRFRETLRPALLHQAGEGSEASVERRVQAIARDANAETFAALAAALADSDPDLACLAAAVDHVMSQRSAASGAIARAALTP